MPKKSVNVEIESSGYDLGQALAVAVKAAKVAKASGAPVPVQVGEDLMAAVSAFSPVASEISQIGADVKEDKIEFIKGLNLAAYDIAEAALN